MLFPVNLMFMGFGSKMGRIYGVHLVVLLVLGMVMSSWCQDDDDSDNNSAVYIVTLKAAPVAHYLAELRKNSQGLNGGDTERLSIHKPRYCFGLQFLSFISEITLL